MQARSMQKIVKILKIRKAKDKNGENVSHLEITEVVLVHCYIANNVINKIQEFYTHLFETTHVVVY